MEQPEILSTLGVQPERQSEIWCNYIAHLFNGLKADTYGRESFSGVIQHREIDSLKLCKMKAQGHRVLHSINPNSSSSTSYYKVVLQHSGFSDFEQGGHHIRLTPGNWAIYDTSKPYQISAPNSIELLILAFPKKYITLDDCYMKRISGRKMLPSIGINQNIYDFLFNAFDLLESKDEKTTKRISDTIVNLFNLTLTSYIEAKRRNSLPETLKYRAIEYINKNIKDHRLSVGMVARHLNCSKRYLHMIFSDSPSTITEQIQNIRLNNVYSELINPNLGDVKITDIAMNWGFSTPSHFSKLFRDKYGVSARELRKNHDKQNDFNGRINLTLKKQ
ncbi:MAG: helix-turn-helix domain-containing protein [Oceanospirillales bacterium]|nr:helix-turn-helix domain-containing protein [Oceanospirillales bacterium]